MTSRKEWLEMAERVPSPKSEKDISGIQLLVTVAIGSELGRIADALELILDRKEEK